MISDQSVEDKLHQQYKLAEYQRRMLVRELSQMIDILEGRPRIQLANPFPLGVLERAIRSVLISVERKWVRKIWVAMSKRTKR